MYIDKSLIKTDTRELKQRLGGADISIASDALKKVESAMNPRYVLRLADVVHTDEGVDLGFGEIKSSNLKRNLRDCRTAYLICITIGSEIDGLLRRESVMGPSSQYLADACASAAVETAVDYVQKSLGVKTMARFAPGYGDFSIEYQKDLLEFTGAGRIGVTLTDSNLMIPTKTITCIMGVLE
ncbi:MAG: hypothetical protein ACI4KE_05730 [Anaerovoracaceae bacterium]